MDICGWRSKMFEFISIVIPEAELIVRSGLFVGKNGLSSNFRFSLLGISSKKDSSRLKALSFSLSLI